MKISIALAADHSFKKGDRVIVKVAANEWYLGSVTRAGAKIKVEFDDGASATIGAEDFGDVRWMKKATKTLKRKATNAEAKEWSQKVAPDAAKPTKKTKAATPADPTAAPAPKDPALPGRVVENGLIRLRHNRPALQPFVLGERVMNAFAKKVASLGMRMQHNQKDDSWLLRPPSLSAESAEIVTDIKVKAGSLGGAKIEYTTLITHAVRNVKWALEEQNIAKDSRLLPLLKELKDTKSIITKADVQAVEALLEPIFTQQLAAERKLKALKFKDVDDPAALDVLNSELSRTPLVIGRLPSPDINYVFSEERTVILRVLKDFPDKAAREEMRASGLAPGRLKAGVMTWARPNGTLTVSWKSPMTKTGIVTLVERK